MPAHTFEANGEWNAGIEAQSSSGYRTLAYDGDLGGGTLQIFTQVQDGPKTVVPDSKLAAATDDAAGDTRKQLAFTSSGNVWVHLTGATEPDVTVTVQ